MYSKIFKEPLIYFFILAILFYWWDSSKIENDQIIISDKDIDLLLLHQGSKSSADSMPVSTINALLQNNIKEELFYRDALQQNLDKEDIIIKRHLLQKYRHIHFNLKSEIDVPEKQLKNFYIKNKNRYYSPAYYNINQNLFSFTEYKYPEKEAMLFIKENANFQNNKKNHLKTHYKRSSEYELRKEFGIQFVDQIKKYNSPGRLKNPIKSGLGYHAVEITEITLPKLIPFDDIRHAVINDFQKEKIMLLEFQKLKELKDRTTITYKLDKYKNIRLNE